jgi:hypothetical protein
MLLRPHHFAKFFFVCILILSLAAFASAQGPSADASVATADAGTSAPAPPPAASTDDGWHVAVTPYLWFAGMHGTVGALGRQTSVHASFGDIISNFNIGFMATFDARKKRFGTTTDLVWMRLSDDKALPELVTGITSVDVKVRQFILTPKLYYRVVDQEKIKVDALVGFRFFHLGEGLEFNPSLIGGVDASQNWADAVGGARFQIPVGEKVLVTIAGDAGGGGASVDYQVAALLGYRIGKKYILQAGYRYLDVNFRGSNAFIYDTATSGIVGGVTISFK